MKQFFLFTLTLIIFSYTITAQSISGKIIDSESKEPLIGVNVVLENGQGTATDINGKYFLKLSEIAGATYKVTYKYIGYKEHIKEFTLNNNEDKALNISLEIDSEKLKTVVVSAGRFEQNLEEITVSMEVIKPALIENKNTTNIETAMDQVPGVNITDGQANIRGGSGWSYGAGTRVLVLVDNMPLISGDAGQVQWSAIGTENINQIEIIKGASSALYGSSALNGVINIRTAFPSQKDIDKHNLPGYSKINMHYGFINKPQREILNWREDEIGTFRGFDFFHGIKSKNLDLSIGGNLFKDDGYRYGEITDRKRVNLNSIYKSEKIKGLSYGINANLLSQESGSVIIWHNLDSAYIPLDGSITKTIGSTFNVDPFISYFNGNYRHSLKTRYLKVLNNNTNCDTIDGCVDAGQDNESEVLYADYQIQKKLTKYNANLTAGITNEMTNVSSDLFSGISRKINNSFYLQFDKKWGKLNVSLGSRYEFFNVNSEEKYLVDGDSINTMSASKPVFRTGLNYQLAEATFIRSSWGQGYRFPSMAELFIFTEAAKGIYVYPNAGLKPESGWSSEIGIKQGVKFGNWLGYIDVAGFLMQYDDMMEFSFGVWGDPTLGLANYGGLGFKSINVGKTQISGVEISVTGQGKLTEHLTINLLAGYTYVHPISLTPDDIYDSHNNAAYIEVYNNGEYMPRDTIYDITYNNSSSDPSVLKYRYQHIGKLDAEIMYKKMSIGSSLRYNDFMKNIDAIFTDKTINEGFGPIPALIPGINEARDKMNTGDVIIDTRFSYQINEFVKAGCVINNLLNREYMTRPANMMPPRTVAFQCNIKI